MNEGGLPAVHFPIARSPVFLHPLPPGGITSQIPYCDVLLKCQVL